MQRLLFLLLTTLCTVLASAQIPFDKTIIVNGFLASEFTYLTKLVDLDKDNDLDLVAVGAEEGPLVWYENLDGLGTFRYQNLITDSNQSNVKTLEIGDINGDGLLDILVITRGYLFWYENLGNNVFSSSFIAIPVDLENMISLALVDIDNDGDNDLFIGSNDTPSVTWIENTDGLGSFSSIKTLGPQFLPNRPKHLGYGDFDGDGSIDLVVGGTTLRVYYNDGNQNFRLEDLDISQPGGQYLVNVMDYDNDGDLDIASGCLLYTSPSPRDATLSRMPSSA